MGKAGKLLWGWLLFFFAIGALSRILLTKGVPNLIGSFLELLGNLFRNTEHG